MISSVGAVLASVASALLSRLDLGFEHLALSHQVMVMRRSRRRAAVQRGGSVLLHPVVRPLGPLAKGPDDR